MAVNTHQSLFKPLVVSLIVLMAVIGLWAVYDDSEESDAATLDGYTLYTGGTATYQYASGTSITISATQHSDSDGNWTYTPVPATVTVPGTTTIYKVHSDTAEVTGSVTITFEAVTYHTVTVSGNITGTTVSIAASGYTTQTATNGRTASLTVPSGTSVTISATNVTGYTFKNWYDASAAITETARTYTYTVTDDWDWTAVFDVKTFTVTFSKTTGGSVDKTFISKVPYNSVITVSSNKVTINGTTVTATPDTGYAFDSWSNASGKVTANRTITANFTAEKFTVTISAGTGGSVDKTSISNIPYGTSISKSSNTLTINGTTVTATASTGYNFSSWSNSTGTITANRTITANFTSQDPQYTFGVGVNSGSGTVSVKNVTTGATSSTSVTGKTGNTINFSATPSTGYELTGWAYDGQILAADNPYVYTVTDQDLTLEAIFTKKTYTVTVRAGAHGSVDTATISNIPYGTSITKSGNTLTINGVTVTATASTGYDFSSWSNSSGTITADRTIIATFVIKTFTVTISASSGGSVDKTSITNVPYGTSISKSGNTLTINGTTVTATPDAGKIFNAWVNTSGVVTSNRTITASFGSEPEYTFEVGVNQGQGTASVKNVTTSTTSTTSVTGKVGNTISFTATPSTGYTFTGWVYNGQILGTDNPYTYTVTDQSLSLDAIFTQNTYTVTIQAGTGGSVNKTSITNVPYGTSISKSGNTLTINGTTVTATANTGYNFSSWSNSTGTITADRTITANFSVGTYTFEVGVNQGQGTVSVRNVTTSTTSTTSVTGKVGDRIYFYATPSTGYELTGWAYGGQILAADNPYIYTVTDQDLTLEAIFTLKQYTVTIQAGTHGSVDKTSITKVPYGSSITKSGNTLTINGTTVTASPDTGYNFSSWSNSTGTITADRTITATFVIKTFTVTIQAGTGGSVNKTSITNVPYGSSITKSSNVLTINGTSVTATPNTGYNFASWSGATGTITANRTITANFTAGSYIFAVGINSGSGTVSVENHTTGATSTTSVTGKVGDVIYFHATPSTGYELTGWAYDGQILAADNPYQYTVTDQSLSLDAIFTQNTYTVTIQAGTGGSVNKTSITNVPYGTSISKSGNTLTINGTTVTATANTGYNFSSWTGATGTITSNRTITANFSAGTYTFEVGVNSGNGTVSVENRTTGTTSTTAVTGKVGDVIYFHATPETGYDFKGWTYEGQSMGTENPYEFTVTDESVTFQAEFSIKLLVVGFQAGTGGSVDKTILTKVPYNSPIIVSGNTVTINGTTVTATPDPGYKFRLWTGATGTITTNKTIAAYFIEGSYTFEVGINSGNGSVSIENHTTGVTSTSAVTGKMGDKIYFYATPSTGYTLTGWAYDGQILENQNPYIYTVTDQDLSLDAIFTINTYTVTIQAGTGGSVNKTSITNVPYGSSITKSGNTLTINGTTVTATPSTGYNFSSWTNATGTITANRTITATFEIKTFTVTFSAGTGGSVDKTSITNVPYGTSITKSGSTVTINGTTVTATPSTGYGFTSWTGATGTVTSSKTITANFSANSYVFEVGINKGLGTVSIKNNTTGATSSTSVTGQIGDRIYFYATPSTGYTHTGWTYDGQILENQNPYIYTVTDQDLSLDAIFTINTYTVSVSADTGGSVSQQTITDVPYGSSITKSGNKVTINGVTVTATPSTGYNFSSWTNATGTITANRTITATFEIKTFDISFRTGAGGSVDRTTITDVPYGSSITKSGNKVTINGVTVTATPDVGYSFSSWTGATGTVTSSKTITAYFSADTFSFEVGINKGQGTVSVENRTTGATSTTAVSGQVGDKIYFYATPGTGYNFTGWVYEGQSMGMENPYEFTVTDESVTFLAEFTIKTFTVTIQAGSGGTVNKTTITDVPYGSAITKSGNRMTINGTTVTATPSTGYNFDSWSNSTGTITANRTITATFEIKVFTVTFSAGTGGSVDRTTITNIPYGTTINRSGNKVTINGTTVTATANTGYGFTSWSGATGTVTSNKTITANFSANTYVFEVGVNSGQGTVSIKNNTTGATSSTAVTGNIGDEIYFYATPSAGYTLTGWAYDGQILQNQNPYIYTVTDQDLSLDAIFTINTYTVSFSAGTGGSVNKTTITNIPYGTSITASGNTVTINGTTVTATANTGYGFTSWSGATGTVTSNKTITANFSANTYTFEVGINKGLGTVSIRNNTTGATSSTSVTGQIGDRIYFYATPSTGYTLTGWAYDGQIFQNQNPYIYTVTDQDLSLDAIFSQNTYTVTFEAGTGGSVDRTTISNVPYGSAITRSSNTITINGTTVTATPDSGYNFSSWANATGTITANRTITANFSLIPVYSFYVDVNAGQGSVSIENHTTGATSQNVVTGVPGDQIYFYATPSTGYTLTGWAYDGQILQNQNPYIYTVTDQDLTLEAIFTLNTYTVTFEAGTGGSVSQQTITNIPHGSSILVAGNTITINSTSVTANPSTGYSFSSWTNATGTVTANRTITANFSAKTFMFGVGVNSGSGSVSIENHTTGATSLFVVTGVPGDQIYFYATPDTGYTLTGWTYDGQIFENQNPYIYTVTDQDLTLEAIFTPNTYTVTFEAGEGGSVNRSSITDVPYGSSILVAGDTITINATSVSAIPDSGYNFSSWTNAAGTITANRTITANFTDAPITTFTFEVGVNQGQGTVSVSNITTGETSPTSVTGRSGDVIHFYATPSTNYRLDGWAYDGQILKNDNPYVYNVTDQGISLDAIFITYTHTVTFDANGGTVSPASKSVTFREPYGALPTPTYTGHRFDGWYTDRIGGTLVTEDTIVTQNIDHTIYAHWSTEGGVWRETNTGPAITSLTMAKGEERRIVFTYATDLSDATFRSSNIEIVDIQSAVIGTVYYWTVTLKANASGTATVTAEFTNSGVSYYKDLSVTVETPSITFYRNYTSSDTTIVATIEQTYGELVVFPEVPDAPAGKRFFGWWNAQGTEQLSGGLVMSSLVESRYYAHWETPAMGGAFYEDNNLVTGTTLNVGTIKKIEFEPSAAAGQVLISMDPNIVKINNVQRQNFARGYMMIEGVSAGTTYIQMTWTDGGVNYYNTLKVTVNDSTTTEFIRNHDSEDNTVLAYIDQVVGSYYSLPEDPSWTYRFLGWFDQREGGNRITSNTLVEKPVIQVIYAHWDTGTYDVTISAGAGGSVSPTVIEDVPYGASIYTTGNTLTINGVTVTATPDTGFIFGGWSNATGVITSDRTITANFNAEGTYTFEVGIAFGEGEVWVENVTKGVSSPTSVTGSPGDLIRFHATPSETYSLWKWYEVETMNYLENNNPYEWEVVSEGAILEAFFVQSDTFTVTFQAGEGGTVSQETLTDVPYAAWISINGNTLTINGTTITATPNEGYVFTSWTNAVGSVTSDRTITANFTLEGAYVFSVFVNSGEGEVGVINTTKGESSTTTVRGDAGDTIYFYAIPSEGYRLANWVNSETGDLLDPDVPFIWGASDGDLELGAVFVQDTFTVTFEAGPNGMVSADRITGIPFNTPITVTGREVIINGLSVYAIPNIGYSFGSWTNADGSVTEDRTITAEFIEGSTYTFEVGVFTGEGTVSVENVTTGEVSETSVTGSPGDLIRFHAYPETGYALLNWLFETAYLDNDNPYEIEVLNEDMTLEAVFVPGHTLTFASNNLEYGNVSPTILENVPEGSTITMEGNTLTVNRQVITATSVEGYRLMNWTVNEVPIESGMRVTADMEITANFAVSPEYQFSIEVTAGQGTVFIENVTTGETSTTTVNGRYGDVIQFHAEAETGYFLINWQYEDNVLAPENPYTITVEDQGMTLGAIFSAQSMLTVTATANIREATVTISAPGYETQTATNGGTAILRVVSGTEVTITASDTEQYTFERWYYPDAAITEYSQTYTYTVTEDWDWTALYIFVPLGDVWWDNGYINGSVNIAFWFQNAKSNRSHTMTIPLMKYDGIKGDGDGTDQFSYSGYLLRITVPYDGKMTCTLTGQGITPITTTYNTGTWSQFTVSIDAQSGKVTFNGTRSAGWNWDKDYNLTNYETVFTKEVMDFSVAVSDLAIGKIYHSDTGTGSNHARFQVTATTTFLETYGYVMVDPTLNIIEKFPDYDNLRLNLYSFAVYGDSTTINGHTLPMDGSRTTLWITEKKESDGKRTYTIADETVEGAYKVTLTLTNIYITWTNLKSDLAEDRQCYLTFVNDNMTINMGSYARNDLNIGFDGIWYFTTALYEPYQATERTYSMDPNSWFNLSSDAFLLAVIGILIAGMVLGNLIFRPSIYDYAIVIGAGIIVFVLIGGL